MLFDSKGPRHCFCRQADRRVHLVDHLGGAREMSNLGLRTRFSSVSRSVAAAWVGDLGQLPLWYGAPAPRGKPGSCVKRRDEREARQGKGRPRLLSAAQWAKLGQRTSHSVTTCIWVST